MRRITKHNPVVCILAALSGILAFAQATQAQQNFLWREVLIDDDFAVFESSKYILDNGARFDENGKYIVLTENAAGLAGRFFLKARREIQTFDIHFSAFFGTKGTPNNGGADGIVCIFAPGYSYPVSFGGELNFSGCDGYGFEMDTYLNPQTNDRSEEHLGMLRFTASNHLHTETLTAGTLKNNAWHAIELSNRDGVVAAIIDGVGRFNYTIPGFTPFNGHFGFSAATGQAFNPHYIDNVYASIPNRSSLNLGYFNACSDVAFDTTIIITNNLPNGRVLDVSTMLILPRQGLGTFTLVNNPPAARLEPGEQLPLTLRFTDRSEGKTTALLICTSAENEAVIDTLLAELSYPQTQWTPSTAILPSTHIGAYADTTIFLHNTGKVAVAIDGLVTTWSEFHIEEPTSFPVTLNPGDSIPVKVRFQPTATGRKNAIVKTLNTCGTFEECLISGEGAATTLAAGFPEKALVLNPDVVGKTAFTLIDKPAGNTIHGLTARILYDPAAATYLWWERIVDVLPIDAQVTVASTLPGTIDLRITSVQPIRQNGPLVYLGFRAATDSFVCAPLMVDTVVFNPEEPFPGIPFSISVNSLLCVNTSCRIPEGMLLIAPLPTLRNAPNPFASQTEFVVRIFEDTPGNLSIIDALGVIRQTWQWDILTSGDHRVAWDAGKLPSGIYRAVLRTNAGTVSHSVLRLR